MALVVSKLLCAVDIKETASGLSAFALGPIAAGTVVAAFGGWVVNLGELRRHGEVAVSRAIQIGDDLYLAPLDCDGAGDYINHSCDPTCGIQGSQLLVARRDIKDGEQLTYDYATTDSSDYDEFACACGAANCRGQVTGTDWQRPELQEKHRGWFSTYLQAKLTP